MIHPEVRKLHPEAVPPDFWFDDSDDYVLVVHYRSRRHLCTLAAGMMEGAGEQYGEHVSLHQECVCPATAPTTAPSAAPSSHAGARA